MAEKDDGGTIGRNLLDERLAGRREEGGGRRKRVRGCQEGKERLDGIDSAKAPTV